MKLINKHLLLILLGFGLIGCDNDFDNSAQRVNGIVLAVYPDKNNLTDSINFEGIKSLEMCRNNANTFINQGNYADADYECGVNCKKTINAFNETTYFCESTSR